MAHLKDTTYLALLKSLKLVIIKKSELEMKLSKGIMNLTKALWKVLSEKNIKNTLNKLICTNVTIIN